MDIYAKLSLLVVLLAPCASAARILALMVCPSNSHHLWNSKYVAALAERGHHVTYFSVNEFKNPPKNVTPILVKNAYDLFENVDFTSFSDDGPYLNILNLQLWDEGLGEFILKSEALRELKAVMRKERFDLVVLDIAVGEYLLGAVDVLGRPPVVAITAFGIPTATLQILGNPMAYSSKPYFYTPHQSAMTLFQRAENFFVHLFSFAVRWFSRTNLDSLSRKMFGEDVRPLEQIFEDVNIIMVNSNYGVDCPFPKVPGLVPVGGLHIEHPKPLPQDLLAFLDGARDGVVYFSLGSNVKSSSIQKKVEIFTKAFEGISPVRVLWKWDSDFVPKVPDNVKLGKWLPQNDILAHSNVRVFFTHSGLLSTQEAIYHGKPVLAMPFLLDQHANAMACAKRGLGEILEYKTLTTEKLLAALRKLLDDPRYTQNAQKNSVLFRDQIESPMERAMYWTEYAIRHKGAPNLRYSGRNLSWYQNSLLDVFALLFAVLYLVYKSLKVIFSRICNKKEPKIKKN